MNELKQLETLGVVLPSPAYLLGALLFGILGLVAFRWGRKDSRTDLTIGGLALMFYPYLVSETWMLWLIGIALSGALYSRRH